MASAMITQSFPILTFVTVASGDAEEKTASVLSSCASNEYQEQLACASDTTCSIASASDRSEGSDADVSDNESSPSAGTPRSSELKRRWADYDSDDEDLLCEAKSPRALVPDYATDDEDFFWEPYKCSEIQPPRLFAPQRTPLRSCASGFVAPQRTRLSSCASGFVPQSKVVKEEVSKTRLDFGKIVAAGLVAMRSSSIVASSNVKEELSGSGWALEARLRPDVKDQFTAIKTITKHVQLALLQAAEVSEQSYVIGYEAEPFAPLGLGFSLQLASVDDDADACWDFIGTGECVRGCRCRWKHPAEQVRVEVRIRLGIGSSE